jgi:hypothetical protein
MGGHKLMGKRRLEISEVLFQYLFGSKDHHYRICNDALPEDATVVSARISQSASFGCSVVELIFESAEWNGPYGTPIIPLLDMRIQTIDPRPDEPMSPAMMAIINNAKHISGALGVSESWAIVEAAHGVMLAELLDPYCSHCKANVGLCTTCGVCGSGNKSASDNRSAGPLPKQQTWMDREPLF